ncbi:MAG TPA: hypothetical protein VFF28_05455 [Candidatus Nanoarchaeia archaeon]|nr:hypothetical protein [Candidatus Nanoarchaeia archaeon]
MSINYESLLYDRYEITAILFVRIADHWSVVQKANSAETHGCCPLEWRINESLKPKNPKKTMIGKRMPPESFFLDADIHLQRDKSLADMHCCLEVDKDGLWAHDLSTYGIAGKDYQGNTYSNINAPQKPIRQLLVPGNIEEKSARCFISFGHYALRFDLKMTEPSNHQKIYK